MPATIKLGSTGSDVGRWQQLLGAAGYPVSVTQSFDALTDQLTRAWQAAKGLAVDGIVGSMSWAAMTGVSAPTGSSGLSADSHRRGRQILANVWQEVTGQAPNMAELQIAGAQAAQESGYGQSSYKLLDHATGATLATSGPINNWGAVQASEGFLATDTSPLKVTEDNPHGYYDHHYAVYATPEEGAKDFVSQMTNRRPTSWALMRAGDIDAWAEQMHAAPGKKDPVTGVYGYFEQAPSSRAHGIEFRVQEIADAMGEPVAARRGGPVDQSQLGSPGSGGGGALGAAIVALFGGLAYWWWKVRHA